MIKHKICLITLLLVIGCQPNDDLGDGFYVTYVDIQDTRGVYYNKQNVNGSVSVKEVFYDDSIIVVSGYTFQKTNRNTANNDSARYFAIVKAKYKEKPDQTQSPGYLGPLTRDQFNNVVSRLTRPKTLRSQ